MNPVVLSVGPRYRDLLGFRINRAWPTARRRLIGPFVFFDHMLCCELPPGRGLDVPPHPHIGLATLTCLFEGELMHRDSMAITQIIRPGELNWMIAGRGVTHSERSSDSARAQQSRLHGTQIWVALPREIEQCEPAFRHVTADELPERQMGLCRVRLLAGNAFGMRAPVPFDVSLHYADVHNDPGALLELAPDLGQRAVYVLAGGLRCAGQFYEPGQLLVFADDVTVHLEAPVAAHWILLGGPKLAEDREVWWNFVATSPETIDAARRRWADEQFPAVPDESGAMKMPEY